MTDRTTASSAAAPLDAVPSAYRAMAARLTAAWTADEAVLRVALSGSIASGRADDFSDLDLSVAVVDRGDVDRVVSALPGLVGRVLFSDLLVRGQVQIFTAVAAPWLRIDVLVEPIDVAVARPRPAERVVLDRAPASALWTAAPAVGPTPDLGEVVESFLRILGLLPVAVGRGEHYVGMKGVMLLRDHLVDLFVIENGGAAVAGAKRLNPLLRDDQRKLLESQPALSAQRRCVVDASVAVARAFLPRAEAAATLLGVPWPAEFDAATRAHLRASLDLDL